MYKEYKDSFNFYVPIEFEKAGDDKKPEERYKNMYIQGCASTSDVDLDNQTMQPSGFELGIFKAAGLINYEHGGKKSPKAFVGEPVEAMIKDNKLFIKGKLWEKSELARDIYDTAEVMKASGSTRKFAWSIEGVPLSKDVHNPNNVPRALITHVALTLMPKNPKTYADICKGGLNIAREELDYDIPIDVPYLYKGVFGNNEYTLNKDFTITKAMCATSETGQQLVGKNTSGAALKKESLDPDLKILTIPISTIHWAADNWENFKKDTKKALQKALHDALKK